MAKWQIIFHRHKMNPGISRVWIKQRAAILIEAAIAAAAREAGQP